MKITTKNALSDFFPQGMTAVPPWFPLHQVRGTRGDDESLR